jgi:hypothetical protein
MARTISEIKIQMTTEFMHSSVIRSLYSIPDSVLDNQFESVFSKVSIENVLFYVIAYAIYVLERIFDNSIGAIKSYIDSVRPHTKNWYSNKIKAFQFGDTLPIDSDVYPTINEDHKIISNCSVSEELGYLKVKVAKELSGTLTPLTNEELEALNTYAYRIKDAGVRLSIVSLPADVIRVNAIIHYDPLVLKSNGTKINGQAGVVVVHEQIKNYLKNLPFDGMFSIMDLTDAIQNVEGVSIVQVTQVRTRTATGIYQDVVSIVKPDSGYFILDEANTFITYIPKI